VRSFIGSFAAKFVGMFAGAFASSCASSFVVNYAYSCLLMSADGLQLISTAVLPHVVLHSLIGGFYEQF
jgi:hypothetical protein